jgi:hypothetical protein
MVYLLFVLRASPVLRHESLVVQPTSLTVVLVFGLALGFDDSRAPGDRITATWTACQLASNRPPTYTTSHGRGRSSGPLPIGTMSALPSFCTVTSVDQVSVHLQELTNQNAVPEPVNTTLHVSPKSPRHRIRDRYQVSQTYGVR